MVFPVFVKVLWANSVIVVLVGAMFLVFTYQPNETDVGILIVYSIVFAAEHLIVEGVAFLLMRKGLNSSVFLPYLVFLA